MQVTIRGRNMEVDVYKRQVLVGANKIGVWGRHKKREKPATNKKVDERPSRL